MGGCGPGRIGDKLILDGRFGEACNAHDDNYATTGLTRRVSDKLFLAAMQEAAVGSRWHRFWARVYYRGVRMFGWPSWQWAQWQAKRKAPKGG